MKFIYIDGDNIGLKIEQSFLNNNEKNLFEINLMVKNAIENISSYLLKENQEIIFSGADGIISKSVEINLSHLLKIVRSADPNLTFSIGIGNTLSDSYIALRYAKSFSKNIAVVLENENYKIVTR
ncbi:hypothetical protein D3C87_335680 [compost metagenome]